MKKDKELMRQASTVRSQLDNSRNEEQNDALLFRLLGLITGIGGERKRRRRVRRSPVSSKKKDTI